MRTIPVRDRVLSEYRPKRKKVMSRETDARIEEINRAKAKRWLQKIAHEEVGSFQATRSTGIYAKFRRRDVREIRQRVIQRVLSEGGERYGFVTVGWLLMVAVASCISWAIKRWLDRRFPERDDKDFTMMLDELGKEQCG